jgi:hypothetical protein
VSVRVHVGLADLEPVAGWLCVWRPAGIGRARGGRAGYAVRPVAVSPAMRPTATSIPRNSSGVREAEGQMSTTGSSGGVVVMGSHAGQGPVAICPLPGRGAAASGVRVSQPPHPSGGARRPVPEADGDRPVVLLPSLVGGSRPQRHGPDTGVSAGSRDHQPTSHRPGATRRARGTRLGRGGGGPRATVRTPRIGPSGRASGTTHATAASTRKVAG